MNDPSEIYQEDDRKRRSRIECFRRALESFRQQYQRAWDCPISIKADAAEHLGNNYFSLHYKIVRRLVSRYSNCFKMAAVTEQVIVDFQPFIGSTGEDDAHANAMFALTCALTIIVEMTADKNYSDESIWETLKTDGPDRIQLVHARLIAAKEHRWFYESLDRGIRQHQRWLEFRDKSDPFPMMHMATFLDVLWHSLQFPIKGVNP